jgi:ATP-binding cassette subfamily B (MDR/TAP) protein 1
VAIVIWYIIMTPLVVKKHVAMQEVEREAAGVARETLSAIRMVAACSADDKMVAMYDKLVDRIAALGAGMSPLLALQHSPGRLVIKIL